MNFRQTVCKMKYPDFDMKYPDFDSDNPFEKYVKLSFNHSTQIFLKNVSPDSISLLNTCVWMTLTRNQHLTSASDKLPGKQAGRNRE